MSLQPAARGAQLPREAAVRADEAMRNLERQVATEVTRTIDVVGHASLVPLHLMGAWSRVWTAWMRDMAGP